MTIKNIANNPEISIAVIEQLIKEQFPQWAHLEIKEVDSQGHDNRTFRLGHDMLIRLPSAESYAAKVTIEQKWLPTLAPHLSFAIPQPIAMGKHSKTYPFNWSIYRWIEGDSANNIHIEEIYLQMIATQLAQFLKELHKINATGGPFPGRHNFFRGGSLIVYDAQTRAAVTQLKDIINSNAAIALWEKAINSKWTGPAVWIHGDLSAGNILIRDNQLIAIIDFGGMAIGDPACDLAIGWTFLKNESRKIFKALADLDEETWARARGWALWKALITLAQISDKNSMQAKRELQIINDLLSENK